MSNLPEARKDVEIESVSQRASVAESTFQDMGSSINFINRRQHQVFQFNYNGLNRLFVDTVGADGVFPCLFDMELIGLSIFQRRGGSSSETIIDMDYFTASNVNAGSIFTTKPKINSTGGDFNIYIVDLLSAVNIQPGVGFTPPVLSKVNFNAGEVINCKITQSMPDSEDLMVMIHYRPR